MEELITMRGISKTFPGVKALDNVSFSIHKGEIHGLAGENGAGKSTFIKVLTGVYTPDAGAQIQINGADVSIRSPIDAASLGIAVIFQDFSLFGNMTVAENIMFTYNKVKRRLGVNWASIRRRAREILKELELNLDVDVPVEQLSVGKQQMVAIAKALVLDAKLLIMDEPTSTLSNAEVEHLYKIMRKLQKNGVAILFVTHKLEEMMSLSDRITVFRDGRCIGTRQTSEITQDDLIRMMVGREIQFQRAGKRQLGEPVLEVQGLSKRGNYRDISLTLRKGEIIGITGLVGSGRSEVLMTLFGLIQPDSGRICLHGKEVAIKNPSQAKSQGLALVPENRLTEGAFLDKTVLENITISNIDAYRTSSHLLDLKKERQLAQEYAETMDVRPRNLDAQVRTLSGGNMQKVVIAKWLLSDPDILLIDEPTNGIDIGAKTEIHRLLQRLAAAGKSIIVVSSEMMEVMALADTILVMSKGRITQQFDGESVTQEAIMTAALK